MRLVLAAALFLGLAIPARADASTQSELDAAKQRFADQHLTNYGFRVQRGCFCPPQYTRRYRIHVRGGKAVGAPKEIRDLDTVPKLFAVIQDAIDRDAERISATYGDDGLPTDVFIDYEAYVVDEELGFSAADLNEEDPTIPHGVDDSIENGTAASDLAVARATWKERGFDAYRFRLRRSCFCPPAHGRVLVRDGRPVRAPKGLKRYATASRLFKLIADAIDRKASGLDVTYGPRGFPRKIAIDYDDLAADEELGFTTSRLHPA
jgi:hypothetical protein